MYRVYNIYTDKTVSTEDTHYEAWDRAIESEDLDFEEIL